MRKLILLTAGLLVPALLMAQLDRVWVSTYNGPCEVRPEEAAVAMAVDEDGYVYVCGRGYGSEKSILDYVTIKYDPTSGKVLWVSYYDGPAHSYDEALAIAVDNSGGVYVTGYSYAHSNPSSFDYATIKYDAADGTELWVARYNATAKGDDNACAIAVDNSGGVYVTGHSWGTNNDYATIKYNAADGMEAWVARYNGPDNGDDFARAIAVDNSGGVYVTGYSATWTWRFFFDHATVKYSASDGQECWVKCYDGPFHQDDYAIAIAVDNAGGVYVTGSSAAENIGYDYATHRYDAADGEELWDVRYNGLANRYDIPAAIALDNTGGVYVAGYSVGSGTDYDYATIKYNASDGGEAWSSPACYSGPGNDFAHAIAVDDFGRVYVTGESPGLGSGYDYLTAAYDAASGEELGVDRFAGSAGIYDRADAIATDAFGSVYVTGCCQNLVTSYDIVTIKYNHPTVMATIDIDPNKLNLKSKGKWVTGYIELPEGSSVEDIDLSTAAISAIDGDLLDPPLYREGPTEVGDYDNDDINDLMVKFSRQKLVGVLIDMGYGDGDKPELTMTGGLAGGTLFKGVAAVELIDKEGGGQGTAADLPGRVSIQQTSPNPFRLFTTVGYGLPAPTHVRLEVYGPAGERVATLVDRLEAAGYHSATWDGRDDAGGELAAGIYLLRFEAGTYTTTRKTQLLR